ncbi:MAG TPA: transposase [Stellaceae bacterium]|jgi:transposase|nr:transposase [Stellaceae bacterium]
MLNGRDQLTREDAITVASIERGVPGLVPAHCIVERFHRMVRDRDPDALPAAWIADARSRVLASFGKGIVADQRAVAAAMTEPWSNSQTEGQITKLKLVRRQMYGRGNLDLLRARIVAPV